MDLTIGIGSTSPLKEQAVACAIRNLGLQATLIPVNVNSRVCVQPVGKDIIAHGARNRAIEAHKQLNTHIAIGIENGVFYCSYDGLWRDVGAVIVLIQATEVLHYSEAIVMPTWAVWEAARCGFKNKTVGQVLHEFKPRISASDPHYHLTTEDRGRKKILSLAVKLALYQARRKYEATCKRLKTVSLFRE